VIRWIVDRAHVSDTENVFPGENWFFYWRTSAALWEGKLQAYASAGPLFIPLDWGFHAITAESFDFGETKPEADLPRLLRAVRALGRDVVLLLPLTPVPFLPNGGVPAFLARGPAQDAHGLAQAFLADDGALNKAHSFYDPRVYQAFRKYVWQLADLFARKGVAVEVRGLRGHWMEGPLLKSALTDFSPAFAQGFLRFLKQQKLPVVLGADGSEASGLAPAEERVQVARYRRLIADLYQQTAAETLANLWAGEQDYAFLGGAPTDVFPLSAEAWPVGEALAADLAACLDWDVTPSSVLLPSPLKSGVLGRALREVVSPVFLQARLDRQVHAEADPAALLPLVFFDLFWDDEHREEAAAEVAEQGLLTLLQRDFRGCWRWRTRFDFARESEDQPTARYKFFAARHMDRARLQHVLRLFLHGQYVVLDRHGLEPMLEKKLQLFLSENDLRPQVVNFLTPVTLLKLEEGMLLLYDGARLKEHPAPRRLEFWQNVTRYLQIPHLAVKGEEPPWYVWKTRPTGPFELNYSEIRRVGFYNSTDHRLKAHIPAAKSFAFLKVVDPAQAQVKSTPTGVDIEVSPGGAVSLDFGHFEG
jgi:hypothetical protein